MRVSVLFAGLLAAVPLFGQLQLYRAGQWFDTSVQSSLDLGGVLTGDTLDTLFSLKNPGASTVTLTIFEVRGTGFSTVSAPAIGTKIPPGGSVDFTVRFRPAMAVAYSASLQADGVSVILRATGTAALSIFLEQKTGRVELASGATADFGSIERGASASLQFRLANQTATALTLSTLAVGDSSFQVVSAPPMGTVFEPGESVPLEIAFEPRRNGSWQSSLQVNQRQIVLAGSAVEPPLPGGTLSLELGAVASAQQGRLSVRLAAPSRTTGAGSVQMEFRAEAGRNDPTVVFANGTRSSAFTISEGDSQARFGSLPYLPFQTGSTAGTIVFTLQLAGKTSKESVLIPAAAPGLEKPVVSRTASQLEVRVTGFDNTRTAGRISFSFLDKDGKLLGAGPVSVDQSDRFREFFEGSDLGGVFALRAVFPVSGPSEQIDAVEIELVNSAGSTRTERVRF